MLEVNSTQFGYLYFVISNIYEYVHLFKFRNKSDICQVIPIHCHTKMKETQQIFLFFQFIYFYLYLFIFVSYGTCSSCNHDATDRSCSLLKYNLSGLYRNPKLRKRL